jgi:hypothetical protein
MRIITLIILLSISNVAYAKEYLIEFKEKCTTTGTKLKFECQPDDERFILFSVNKSWSVKTTKGQVVADFRTLQEDENILILEAPTLFSGNRTLYIMKKNKQFYLLEAGYSEILNNNEATLKQGSFLEFNK